jgi:ABC-type glycerol-3-phosphate transport system substrate-binding protein
MMTILYQRTVLLAGAILLLCGGLIGCPDRSVTDESGESAALPFAETSLVVFVPQSADDSERWTVLLSEWMARSGATCEVRVYDDAAGFEANHADWNGAGADSAVVLFPRAWLGEMWGGGHLATIPEDLQSVEELNWRDLHPRLADACYQWGKLPSVLPVREPLLLLYYRADLLEQAGLSPPRTWDEYHELISTLDVWAPGLTAVEPWGESFRANLFLARSMPYVKTTGNYSVFLDYSSGDPLIATPGFVRGLEESVAAWEWLDPASSGFSPDDCLEQLASGRAAVGIASAFPDEMREFSEASTPDAEWGVAPLPGAAEVFDPGRQEWQPPLEEEINRVTLTGWEGLLAGVLSRGDERSLRASWNLLRALLVEAGADAFTPGRMTGTRLSTSR